MNVPVSSNIKLFLFLPNSSFKTLMGCKEMKTPIYTEFILKTGKNGTYSSVNEYKHDNQ